MKPVEADSETMATDKKNSQKKEWVSPVIEIIGLDKTAGGRTVWDKENGRYSPRPTPS